MACEYNYKGKKYSEKDFSGLMKTALEIENKKSENLFSPFSEVVDSEGLLKHKDFKSNLQESLKEAGYKNVSLTDSAHTKERYRKHNEQVAVMAEIASKTLRKIEQDLRDTLSLLPDNEELAEVKVIDHPGDRDRSIYFLPESRKYIEIVWNERALNEVDKYKKSQNIYENRTPLYDHYDELYRAAMDERNEELRQMLDLYHEEFGNDEDLEENVDSKDLYSAFISDPSDDFDYDDSEFITFTEWKNKRMKLLSDLKKVKERFLKRKENRDRLKEINSTINKLTQEIASFDDTDPNNVHRDIIAEINTISDLLNLETSDPVQIANLLDTNQVEKRLQDLELIFYDSSLPNGDVYNLHAGLDADKVQEIKAKVGDLRKKYNDSLAKIVFGVISSNEIVTQQKQYFKEQGKIEDFEKFIEAIKKAIDPENLEFSIDGDNFFGKNFLGAGSYDSILAEIILLTRDIQKNKESGITAKWKTALRDSYDKIKSVYIIKKQANGRKIKEYFIDKLFQVDEFGIKKQKLISYITPEFLGKIKILKSGARNFYFSSSKEEKNERYKEWMYVNSLHLDYINPAKIKSFTTKYKDNLEFSPYFKYSESEMAQYEAEMREAMGDTAFELELEKQEKAFNDFLIDGFETAQEKENANPLKYIEKFYSGFVFDVEDTNYILPTYVRYIPKITTKSHYNKSFRDIENENVEGFKEFYKNAKNLIDYTIETQKSEGIDVEYNDILALNDSASREAKSQLSTFGSVKKELSAILKSLFSNFYNSSFENPDSDKNFDKKKNRQKLNSHFSSYGSKQIKEMTALLQAHDINELIAVAEKEGLVVLGKYKTDSQYNKSRIAEAIARNRINKTVSLDLYKRIMYGTELAESVNARRGTEATINLVREFAEQQKAQNTGSFIETWRVLNIVQPGYLDTGLAGRVERKKLPFSKSYTDAEKILKEFYESEKHNIGKDFNFTYENVTYYKKGNKIYKKDSSKTDKEKEVDVEEIQQSEAEIAYEKYIKEKIDELGTDLTIGSMMSGFAWNMYKTYLYVSMASGLKNRLAGYNQNNQMAASGLHGFDMSDLVAARKLLAGHTARKIVGYTGLNFKSGKKIKQIKILDNLVQSLGLFENIMTEIDAGDGSTTFVGQKTYNKIKETMSDFAMNIPEYHNQMELLIAMMANVKIQKKDGTYGTLYDKKKGEFIFNSDMSIKDEYATEANKKNWEEFKSDEDGNASHSVLIQNYIYNKHKGHGNYRVDDKIAVQSTMTGRASTAFIKWVFENTNNEYGSKQISLATAEINVRGRKVPLMERFPVLGTHLLLQNVGLVSIAGGVIGLNSLASPFVLAGIGVTSIGTLTYLLAKNKLNVSTSMKDFRIAWDYAKEVALRALKTTTISLTKGVITPFSEETIDKYTNGQKATYKDRNLSFRDRKLLSESAQQVADKYSMAIQFAIAGLVLQALYTMAVVSPDDDDEDKMKKLEEIEGNLKYLINTKNEVTSEMEKWTDISKLKDNYSAFVLLRFLETSKNKTLNANTRYNEGRISNAERWYDIAEGVSGVALGVPRNILRLAHPERKLFTHDRIYDYESLTFIDQYILNSQLSPQATVKKEVERDRRKVRIELEGIFRKKIRDEFTKEGRKDFHNIESMVKKNVKDYLKDKGVYKDKNNSYESIKEDVDWEAVKKEAQESDAVIYDNE